MKKRIILIVAIIGIMAMLIPTKSRAAIVPYFMAVNDTLLPFSEDNMPYVYGGEIFISHKIFGEVEMGVWSVAAEELERIRMYGRNMIVDFYTDSGVTEDKEGKTLNWPSARRVGNRFYIPLRYVCDYFGLTYEILDVGRDIISQEQMHIIRIKQEGYGGLNGPTFVGYYRNALRAAYNEYYAPPPTVSPTTPLPPGEETPQPPIEEPPPTYSDVTIYHSFYDISAGGVDVILDLLDANVVSDFRFCFFVNERDVINDAGLIRKIAASGHAIGIWLDEGTYAEYLETSALLYEATKIRTVIVACDDEDVTGFAPVVRQTVVFWGMSQSLFYDDTLSVDEVTSMISQDSGERQTLISSCSENTALMLSGILSYLREFEYLIPGITESTEPA